MSVGHQGPGPGGLLPRALPCSSAAAGGPCTLQHPVDGLYVCVGRGEQHKDVVVCVGGVGFGGGAKSTRMYSSAAAGGPCTLQRPVEGCVFWGRGEGGRSNST